MYIFRKYYYFREIRTFFSYMGFKKLSLFLFESIFPLPFCSSYSFCAKFLNCVISQQLFYYAHVFCLQNRDGLPLLRVCGFNGKD